MGSLQFHFLISLQNFCSLIDEIRMDVWIVLFLEIAFTWWFQKRCSWISTTHHSILCFKRSSSFHSEFKYFIIITIFSSVFQSLCTLSFFLPFFSFFFLSLALIDSVCAYIFQFLSTSPPPLPMTPVTSTLPLSSPSHSSTSATSSSTSSSLISSNESTPSSFSLTPIPFQSTPSRTIPGSFQKSKTNKQKIFSSLTHLNRSISRNILIVL